MKLIQKTSLSEYLSGSNAMSAIAIEDTETLAHRAFIDGFDLLVMTVCDVSEHFIETVHVIDGTTNVQVLRVSPTSLERWIIAGENRNIIQWLIQGEIWWDRDGYLAQLRESVVRFDNPLREQRMFAEFALFLRTYMHAKQYLQDGHALDAYHRIMEALQHWAGIAVIEQGAHPEVTVWNQVRDINVGIYKLYEELTVSQETVEQRVQLVLLACEFSVMSKMKECCSLLLRILSSRPDPWSIRELMEHPELFHVRNNLSLVLQMLVKKGWVHEVAVLQDSKDGYDALPFTEIRYI
ncbi:nucleotidyltransferase-like protein [Paenibacillus sp. CECT 9249]|uniref:nucleotidyltransferase-like protein n=1 Tax=unclassified Paenibacillus TaxID=185978 RepID=UPI001C11F761|nr:nucleotidyltransferase-like protein [Paenibacillus sp. CECT 9249]MBU5445443.1 hypothetical protein [Paenibacillus sp. MSJ-34]CAH0122583.1 hypothetical protein PAE9249_05155 [Paenibacillus sp. CECT 9249]